MLNKWFSIYSRAPELVMGCTSYTTKVDIWSAGLIVAEMFLLHPVFCGESNLDQLTEMIRMLGTPTRKEIRSVDFQKLKNHIGFII